MLIPQRPSVDDEVGWGFKNGDMATTSTIFTGDFSEQEIILKICPPVPTISLNEFYESYHYLKEVQGFFT